MSGAFFQGVIVFGLLLSLLSSLSDFSRFRLFLLEIFSLSMLGLGIHTVSPCDLQCATTNLHCSLRSTVENLIVIWALPLGSDWQKDLCHELLYQSVSISRKRGGFSHLRDLCISQPWSKSILTFPDIVVLS